jgi:hypothetical protein
MRIESPGGAGKPLYRAFMLAGSLYAIARSGPIDPDKFIVDEQKGFAVIYYDDRLLYSVDWLDIKDGGDTFAQKAAERVDELRLWALGQDNAVLSQ